MTDQINLGIVWANAGGVTPVDATKYSNGWVAEIPTYQNFNYVLKGIDQNLLHLAESGNFEWEADITYKVGVRVRRLGVLYRCKVENSGNAPEGDSTKSFWVTGDIVGSPISEFQEYEGLKVKMPARPANSWTGQDLTLLNSVPAIALNTLGTTSNIAIANLGGEAVIADLGQVASPDGRSLSTGSGNSKRIFHEGHLPTVGEVVGAIPDAPIDGKLYARRSTGWTQVTSTTVSDAPPPAVIGSGQGWYNLDDGLFYVDINDGDSSQWVPANPPIIPRLADPIRSVIGSASRNVVITPNPLKESAIASTVGFSAAIYTGNGATQSISTGIDGSTGDFGALVWMKRRDTTGDNGLFDTVRGATKRLATNGSGVEDILSGLTSFDSGGFTVGSSAIGNTNGGTYASWSWQTTKKVSGTTNAGKPYTCHYNPDLGFSMTGYEGSGLAGHGIPNKLGKKSELSISKQRNGGVTDWLVFSPMLGENKYLRINDTSAVTSLSGRECLFLDSENYLGPNEINASGLNNIQYNFTSVPGVSKVGTYVGTGAVGNYVDCGFKVGWVLVKNLDTAARSWIIADSARGAAQNLYANDSFLEETRVRLDFVDGGFVCTSGDSNVNTLNDKYLFMAFADTNATAGRTNYDRSIGGNQVTVNDGTLISYANGFDQDGENNFNEDVVGDTVVTLPAGSESKRLWVYKDQGGAYGTTEFRPLEGVSRDQADKFGVVSPLDLSTRSADQHSGYESATGVVSASTENGTSYLAWHAFNKDTNDVVTAADKAIWLATTTTGWLQYKFKEPRVLKSWRIRTGDSTTRIPRLFTVEGSRDGLNWTAIDSTYTASNFIGGGISLWSDLQDTSANTVAYTYHRILITANNGDASYVGLGELEFNTITPSDYYNVPEGIMYDSSNLPISRTYIGSVLADGNGDVTSVSNEGTGKFKAVDAELQGDLVVHGNILSKGVATAQMLFDGRPNPPTAVASFNISHLVDLGTGKYRCYFETPMVSPYAVALSVNAYHIMDSGHTPQYFDFSTWYVSSTGGDRVYLNLSDISVIVFGGKA